QMADPEPLGDEAVATGDHVAVAVVREVTPEAIGGLARPPAAKRGRHDQEITVCIYGLTRSGQFVSHPGTHPVGTRSGICLSQHSPAALRPADPTVRYFSRNAGKPAPLLTKNLLMMKAPPR